MTISANKKKPMAKKSTVKSETVSLSETMIPTRSRQKAFLTINEDLACEGLTSFLQGLSVIDDDHEVTHITKAPGALDLKIERIANEDH